MTRKIWETRTFWAGLATATTVILGVFNVTDDKITQLASTIFGFLTVVFARDGILVVEDQNKQIIAQTFGAKVSGATSGQPVSGQSISGPGQ